MRVFIAHSKSDGDVARAIATKLRSRNATVFLDEDDLPAGLEFDEAIRKAIERCDVFMFLLSPTSNAGGYAQTELGIARKRWPNPAGRVLSVMVSAVDLANVDPYLTAAATVLRPKGDVATEAAHAAHQLARRHAKMRLALVAGGSLVVAAGAVIAWQAVAPSEQRQVDAAIVGVATDATGDRETASIDVAEARGSLEGVFELRCDCNDGGSSGSVFCGAFVVDDVGRYAITHDNCSSCPADRRSPCTYSTNAPAMRGCSFRSSPPPLELSNTSELALVELTGCSATPQAVTFAFGGSDVRKRVRFFGIPVGGDWTGELSARLAEDLEGGIRLDEVDTAYDYVFAGPVYDSRDRVIGVLTTEMSRGGGLGGPDATVLRDGLRARGISILWSR